MVILHVIRDSVGSQLILQPPFPDNIWLSRLCASHNLKGKEEGEDRSSLSVKYLKNMLTTLKFSESVLARSECMITPSASGRERWNF